MHIGVPSEIKNGENRVGLVPGSVRELVSSGHTVVVETGAGVGIHVTDKVYQDAGATIVESAEDVYKSAEMIVKVKEPLPAEYALLREDQILFTYLHLAPDPKLTQALIDSGVVAIAYETVTDSDGGLPLLSPMSEVAGRLSIQAGAHCLEAAQGGRGLLLGGVPGVEPANVLVIGGGRVGTNAVRMAMGLEAHVTVLDTSLDRLQQLDLQFGSKLNTIFATRNTLEQYLYDADVVVCAVLVPGRSTPKLINAKMLKKMAKGSVIVDVAIDQGGCVETSHPTTHSHPTFVVEDIVHYCVANMPGAVPRTATFALNNATLPFVQALANKGYKRAMIEDPNLLNGLNIYHGNVTYEAVAGDQNKLYTPALDALNTMAEKVVV